MSYHPQLGALPSPCIANPSDPVCVAFNADIEMAEESGRAVTPAERKAAAAEASFALPFFGKQPVSKLLPIAVGAAFVIGAVILLKKRKNPGRRRRRR